MGTVPLKIYPFRGHCFLPSLGVRSGIAALRLLGLSLALTACDCLEAADIATSDGLSVAIEAPTHTAVERVLLDGRLLPGVSIGLSVRQPQGTDPADDRFVVTGAWSIAPGHLLLRGEVRVDGTEDCATDLVIRVEGVSLPLGSMDSEPLLLPRRLLSKLPLVSLRVGGQDCLALAVPADALATYDLRETGGGVELRFPLGFTSAGPPTLRMRAPFAVALYRTDPRWHFRSALARYYALWPEPFASRAASFGGWFFAAPVTDLPNPQHFYYHEGGPNGNEDDAARGLGTFPYRESSSLTVSLPGKELPKSYEEAMEQLSVLETQTVAADWAPMQHFDLDDQITRRGKQSIRVRADTAGQWVGARQAVQFDEPVSMPFVVRGWSRTQDVTGSRDHSFAIYVDVCYADGSYLFGQCAEFAVGTHDWESAVITVTPAKPVAELRVYALMRGTHTGTAWFDDLHIGPANDAAVNWLANPGFEKTSPRADLGFMRDNVCTDAQDRLVMRITDNLSADVPPSTPLNLLRFTLNVDPDLPERQAHPTVAAREFAHFDSMLRDVPGLQGLYIDSVSAWCSVVLNTRREHWIANDVPFTYVPGSHRVAAAGLFGTRDYLAALQQRYRPAGKLVFTNIHCSHAAFPLYLVSDIPGIESSRFRSEDDLFFYRACSYRKPLLLMNFMNLHGLDERAVAEAFHLNAAFWGEIPSTGRFVQRAYQEYGDLTHAYMPAIRELARAGWEPVPACSGLRAERFGGESAVMWTVRRNPDDGTVLAVDAGVLDGLGRDLVAIDPVWLVRRPMQRVEKGYEIDLADAPMATCIVRVCARGRVPSWLLERARDHALAASRVRGLQSALPAVVRALEALDSIPADDHPVPARLEGTRQALLTALEAVPTSVDDLFALSQRRELQQAVQALEALALFEADLLGMGFTGERIGRAGATMPMQPALPDGTHDVRCLGQWRNPGRALVPTLVAAVPAGSPLQQDERLEPGQYAVRAVFETELAGMTPIRFERVTCQKVLDGAMLALNDRGCHDGMRRFRLTISQGPQEEPLRVLLHLNPPVSGMGETLALEPGQKTPEWAVPLALDGLQRTLTVDLVSAGKGTRLARTEMRYTDEPPPPTTGQCKATATKVDSSYSGYDPAVLTDGVIGGKGLHWTQRAWASADNGQTHWVNLDLDGPRAVTGISLYWNYEEQRTYASRRYRVLLQTPDGLREMVAVQDDRERTCDQHSWDAIEATAIRLEQEAKGGPAQRPGILWLREVTVSERGP